MKKEILNPMEQTRKALQKALDSLEGPLREAHDKYLAKLSEAREIRQQLDVLDSTLARLRGISSDPLEAKGEALITCITEALMLQALTLKELQDHVEIHGFSRHAVRKALAGIAFSKNSDNLYVLREVIYNRSEKSE